MATVLQSMLGSDRGSLRSDSLPLNPIAARRNICHATIGAPCARERQKKNGWLLVDYFNFLQTMQNHGQKGRSVGCIQRMKGESACIFFRLSLSLTRHECRRQEKKQLGSYKLQNEKTGLQVHFSFLHARARVPHCSIRLIFFVLSMHARMQ